MGLTGMVFGAAAAVVGAITNWVVSAQSSNPVQNYGFRPSAVGVIMMVAGGVGFVVFLIVSFTSSRAPSVSD